MLNEVGKYLRKVRIDRDEILKDMATKLNVTVAYLSAVETGKREMPEEWVSEIINQYDLDEKESLELKNAAFASKKNIKFRLDEETERDKDLVLAFARRFRELSDDDVSEMKRLLERK